MTDAELDARIRSCADGVRGLCNDLIQNEALSFEQTLALGTLTVESDGRQLSLLVLLREADHE